jgi:hypothetical protein
MSNLKNEHWALECELRQFINIATRYPIDGVLSTVTQKNPYSTIFQGVHELRRSFELFRAQLLQELSKHENWKALERYLKNQFLSGVDIYTRWYETNKKETSAFGNYNPYEIIYEICLSTKREILIYFDQIVKNESIKTYTNQLSDSKKNILDSLIKDGFSPSHVYQYLKREKQIITLTEIEYQSYLNQHHNLKLDVNKRITGGKNLTLPKELIEKAKLYINENDSNDLKNSISKS